MNNESDRREFYRLDETLLMQYKPFPETPGSNKENEFSRLIDEFSEITSHIGLSISRMHYTSPEVATCFKLLDSKINLLSQAVLYSDNKEGSLLKERHANISAGGMSFGIDEELKENILLEIQLILPPDLKRLVIKAQVVACVPCSSSYQYSVSVKFLDMSEVAKDIIVRHIMHVQSNRLRSKNT